MKIIQDYIASRKKNRPMTNPAIYLIFNKINGKQYIGSAVNFTQRKAEHIRTLRGKRHKNKHLQNAWNKYGEDSFEFSILEYVDNVENLIFVEQRYMDFFKPQYNKCPVAGNMLGFRHTMESRAKMREASLVNWQNPEYHKHMVNVHTGNSPSVETRNKISEISRGERNGWSKLTDGQVYDIKVLLRDTSMTAREIANIYNVSRRCIGAINSGQNWKHIDVTEVM